MSSGACPDMPLVRCTEYKTLVNVVPGTWKRCRPESGVSIFAKVVRDDKYHWYFRRLLRTPKNADSIGPTGPNASLDENALTSGPLIGWEVQA